MGERERERLAHTSARIQQHLNSAETMCVGLVSNVQTSREVMGHACVIIASTITKHYYLQDLCSGPYKQNHMGSEKPML